MTIPKFRVYDKVECMMITTSDYEDLSDLFCCLNADDGFFSELMQSTGLIDKNGEEVFEGDIIRFFDCDGDGYTVPVVWDNDYACFNVDWGSNMLTSFDYLEEFYTDLKDIEVIGNIYENLSLIR